MPPRWSRKPDRADPDFRRLDDRMTFATHVALFAAINSGLWFFRLLGEKTSKSGLPGGPSVTPWITTVWAAVLVAHAVFIFAIAQYSQTATASPPKGGTGFGSNANK
ncbi:MAG: 2TM domain-containing protein [Oscillatoriales cyanobacterium C42_A2020_001]|nr:2TM domain-containing protein [Leptolyngbyaceae cyanobacterium C42_A2020_001]